LAFLSFFLSSAPASSGLSSFGYSAPSGYSASGFGSSPFSAMISLKI